MGAAIEREIHSADRTDLFVCVHSLERLKKKRLTTEELAVVEALVRDVAATVGVSDQAAYKSWSIAETLDLLSGTTQRHDLLSFAVLALLTDAEVPFRERRPEPDFKYFSKRTAMRSSENSIDKRWTMADVRPCVRSGHCCATPFGHEGRS